MRTDYSLSQDDLHNVHYFSRSVGFFPVAWVSEQEMLSWRKVDSSNDPGIRPQPIGQPQYGNNQLNFWHASILFGPDMSE